MLKIYALGFLFCLFNLPISAQLIPFRSGDLWGYADQNRQIVVPVQFEEAGHFVQRLELLDPFAGSMNWPVPWTPLKKPIAVFKQNGHYGLIGVKGQILSPPVAPERFSFSPAGKGAYWVDYRVENMTTAHGFEIHKRALLYNDGEQLTPFDYEYVNDDLGCGSQGMGQFIDFATQKPHDYITMSVSDKYGVISSFGKVIVPAIWSSAIPSERGYTLVSSTLDTMPIQGYTGSGCYLLNPQNKIIGKIQNAGYGMSYVGHGYWALKFDSGKVALVDHNGNTSKLHHYTNFWGFNEYGYAWVSGNGEQWEVINTALEVVFRLPLQKQWSQHATGYWIEDNNGVFREYDQHFKEKSGWESISIPVEVNLCDGKYWAYQSPDGLWHIKDHKNIVEGFDFMVTDTIINRSDQWGYNFKFNFLSISQNQKTGVADCDLKIVIPPQFKQISLFKGPDLWLVGEPGNYGIYSLSDNKLLVPEAFDEIRLSGCYSKQRFSVRKGKNWGLYELNGNELYPAIYNTDISCINTMTLVKGGVKWHVFDETQTVLASFELPPHDTLNPPRLSRYYLAGNDVWAIRLTINGNHSLYSQWGELLIPPSYGTFYVQDKYVFADKAGKKGVLLYPELCEFISFKYESIVYDNGGFILQKSTKDKKFIYYDPVTRKISHIKPSGFTLIGGLKEGLLIVHKDCKHGYVDENMNVVIPLRYKAARPFYEGLAAVADEDGLWGFINRQGEQVVKPQFQEVEPFYRGRSLVRFHHAADWEMRFALIDREGQELIASPSIYRVGNLFVLKNKNDYYTVLDSNLTPLTDRCQLLHQDDSGKIYFLIDGQVRLINQDGSERAVDQNLYKTTYPDGRAAIQIFTSWGLQDKNQHWLIPLQKQFLYSDLKGEFFIVSRSEGVGLFSSNGKLLVPFQYDNIVRKGSYFEAQKNGLKGLLDLKGRLIVPVQFDEIEFLPEYGLISVQTPQGKTGYFDLKANPYFTD